MTRTNVRTPLARAANRYDAAMRKLTIAVAMLLAAAAPVDADVGIGVFLGEPLGLNLKLDLQRNSALDIVLGTDTYRDDRGPYGHLTYLVTPIRGNGRSVIVPLRLGIGVAVFDQAGNFGDDINVAARLPLQVGFVFRNTPLETYLEIAVKLTLLDEFDNHPFADLDGGLGIRFYF